MFFQMAAAQARNPYGFQYPYFDNPFSYQSTPPLWAAPQPTYQEPPQKDEAADNLVDAALSYAVPQYSLIKAGAQVLDSPNVSGLGKLAAAALVFLLLSGGQED
jgi:hypothetical protein